MKKRSSAFIFCFVFVINFFESMCCACYVPPQRRKDRKNSWQTLLFITIKRLTGWIMSISIVEPTIHNHSEIYKHWSKTINQQCVNWTDTFESGTHTMDFYPAPRDKKKDYFKYFGIAIVCVQIKLVRLRLREQNWHFFLFVWSESICLAALVLV